MTGKRLLPIIRKRWMLGPAFVALVILMLVGDHAAWRRWLVAATLAAAAVRSVHERRHPGEPLVAFGPGTRHVVRDVGVALAVGLPVIASGGFDSPMLPFVITVCFFVGTIAATRTLVAFALTFAVLIALLALVSSRGLVPDLVPAVFGGGPGVPQARALLYSKAAGLVAALGYAAALSHVVRQVFREMVGDAIDARDGVLRDHEAHARELTALSGELAHEIKNPLANVKGLAVLVAREVHGKAVERIEILQREVGRMEEILQSFLTFSRPLSPLNEQDVDLPDLCRSVLALHEGVAHARNVSLGLEASGSVHVLCDPRKVKQILINLVQNALEASPSGTAVQLVLVADPKGVARVEVRDLGPGIPAVVRAHLFEPGSTTKERGTGLGLALARGLARQHGGDVFLADREGGGCTATLTLPARTSRPREEDAS